MGRLDGIGEREGVPENINTTGNAQTIKTPITLAGSVMNDVINNKEVIVPVTIDLEPYGYNIIMN